MKISRVYRLMKLMVAMRSGRAFDADALAKEVGVSRRTFFRDLELMEKAGIPYRFEHGPGRYSIAEGFFLAPVQFDVQEALALLLVTRKFLARQVHPIYQKAIEAALKIESTLPRTVLEHCGSWLDSVTMKWPAMTSAEGTSSFFQMLQFALADRQRVNIRYDSVYDGGEIEDLLEPMRLVFMSRGWYLIARSRKFQSLRTFKLDRFTEINLAEEHFEPDPAFDVNQYFGSAWQMIPDGKVHDIRLRFDAKVAASVEEVHWHDSQQTSRMENGDLIFEARVSGLNEIVSWILGYGGQVEVEHPPELRELVLNKAKRIVARSEPSRAGAA